MPEPRRRGPGAWALTLQRGSRLSSPQGQGRETELREADYDLLASSYHVVPKLLLHQLPTSKHIPCPLCCQTCNLNTPKMQSHSGPKTNSLNLRVWESPNQALFTTAFLFSYCSLTLFPGLCFLVEKSSSPHSVRHLTTTKHHLDKTNQMPQRPKSILQVCDLTAQLDLQSTSQSAQTHSGPSTRQC